MKLSELIRLNEEAVPPVVDWRDPNHINMYSGKPDKSYFIVLGPENTFLYTYGKAPPEDAAKLDYGQMLDLLEKEARDGGVHESVFGIQINNQGEVVLEQRRDHSSWAANRNRYSEDTPKIAKELLRRGLVKPRARIGYGNWARQEIEEPLGTVSQTAKISTKPRKLTLFHGTDSLTAAMILRHGLRPALETDNLVWSKDLKGKPVASHRGHSVYLTALQASAQFYANKSVKQKRANKFSSLTPVVFRITLTSKDFKNLRADDDYLARIPPEERDERAGMESLKHFGQVAYVGTIPPGQIEVVSGTPGGGSAPIRKRGYYDNKEYPDRWDAHREQEKWQFKREQAGQGLIFDPDKGWVPMIPEGLNEAKQETLMVDYGVGLVPVRVWIDPGLTELIGLVNRSHDSTARSIAVQDQSGKSRVLVWDGYDATHEYIRNAVTREWKWQPIANMVFQNEAGLFDDAGKQIGPNLYAWLEPGFEDQLKSIPWYKRLIRTIQQRGRAVPSLTEIRIPMPINPLPQHMNLSDIPGRAMKVIGQKLSQMGYKLLGAGAYGQVYSVPNKAGIVFKVFVNDDCYLDHLQLSQFTNNPHFPRVGKIYKIYVPGEKKQWYGVYIERLEPGDMEQGDWAEQVWPLLNDVFWGKSRNQIYTAMAELERMFPKFREAYQLLKTEVGVGTNCEFDIKPENIMSRDGVPVFTDPVAG